MEQSTLNEALQAFFGKTGDFIVSQIPGGLINLSYKVINKSNGPSFLLQQLNKHVFQQPHLVQENYELIWHHLEHNNIDLIIPEPVKCLNNNTLYCDSSENYWRVFKFIEHTKSLSSPETPEQAKLVASIFGRFSASLANAHVHEFNTTIPGFHNLSDRFKQFELSLKSRRLDRLQQCAGMVDQLKKRENYVNLFEVFISSPAFPKRLMHHDAKIGNVLFEQGSGKAVCAVDYDTVMPGYYFSDLGDLIRSMAGSANENDHHANSITIRKNYYEAIMSGYLQKMDSVLTTSEKKYIHHAGIFIIYMQSLRFVSDYLNGDIYYQISYPEQNFDRAKNQLHLLLSLEVFLQQEYNYSL